MGQQFEYGSYNTIFVYFLEIIFVDFIINSAVELANLITEADKAKSGKLNFDNFFLIAGNFLEDEDDEAMQNELKEAFRLYDKAGNVLLYSFHH